MRERMLGVSLYQGFDEGGFSNTWRANDSNDGGRRFRRESIDERNMKAFLFDLNLSSETGQQRQIDKSIHRESEPLSFEVCRDVHMRMLWDFYLSDFSIASV